MRTLWMTAVIAAVLALFVFVGCNQDPSTPANNNSEYSSGVTGGSVHNPGVDMTPHSRRSNSMDSDIALSQTVYGTDYVSAGVGGMRGQTFGNITLAGLSGTVSLALLYWDGPTNSLDPNENASVTVNGNAVTGTNIGFSNDNCWGYDNTQAYVADVTTLVQATGNGVYALTDFGSASSDNNGASLIVFFDDGDNTNNRDVVLFHGNDSNIPNSYDADGWNVSLSGINYTAGSANLQLHVADGQTYPDDALTLNGDGSFVPGPQVFDGNTVPSDNNGPLDNGNLWDIRTFDVTSYLSVGPNTLTLTTGTVFDCLGLIVAIIDLPAGAAPVSAQLDIHPTSCPNPLNVRSQGVTPVAIIGSASFDVTQIDRATILLNGVAPIRTAFEDVAGPDGNSDVCECGTDGPDGYLDFTLKFRTQDLVPTLGTVDNGDVVVMTATFSLLDGTQFSLSDCVVIRGLPNH